MCLVPFHSAVVLIHDRAVAFRQQCSLARVMSQLALQRLHWQCVGEKLVQPCAQWHTREQRVGRQTRLPFPNSMTSQRVERYVGSGDTEVVDAITAGGDGYRLATCNGSLSSSDSILQPRLNEGSVITVTACCAWQPAFLQRCCGFRPRASQLQVFFFGISEEDSGGGGGKQ